MVSVDESDGDDPLKLERDEWGGKGCLAAQKDTLLHLRRELARELGRESRFTARTGCLVVSCTIRAE